MGPSRLAVLVAATWISSSRALAADAFEIQVLATCPQESTFAREPFVSVDLSLHRRDRRAAAGFVRSAAKTSATAR